jgi:hypothetical protein
MPRIKATKATTKARHSLDQHRSTEEVVTFEAVELPPLTVLLVSLL